MSLLAPSWLTFGGAVALAFVVGSTGGAVKGYEFGEARTQAKWDAQALKDRQAIDNANIAAQAAAELYEEAKAKQQIKVVTITREVNHALQAAPEWSSVVLPPGVRDAIAAAASSAPAASEPDGAVRLPAAGGADERATGDGLPAGAGSAGRVLDAASVAR